MLAAAHEPDAAAELVVLLRSRRQRRRLLAQQLQHVIAGAGRFFSGIQSLSAGAEGLENPPGLRAALTEAQRRIKALTP